MGFVLHKPIYNFKNFHEKSDGIVVLTGGKDRIQKGFDLFVYGKAAPRILITGIHPKTSDEDILSMWEDRENPLPQCCITLGREATTTIENAIEAKQWIDKNKIKEIHLVTSIYHMERSLKEFENMMPEIVIHPIRISNDQEMSGSSFWYLTFSEYNKNLFRDATIYVEKNFLK